MLTLKPETIKALEDAGFAVMEVHDEYRICHVLPDSDEGIITEGESAGQSIEDYDAARWAICDAIVGDEADTDICGWLVDGESGITLPRN